MPALCGKIGAGIGLLELLFLGARTGSQCTARGEDGNRHALGLMRPCGGGVGMLHAYMCPRKGGPQQ